MIRLGRRFGFQTLNVVRREDQVEELQQLGGDRVLVFDPRRHDKQQLREQVLQATDNKKVPYAIDPVGGATGSAVVDCLGKGGRMLVYGTLTDEPLSFSPRELMQVGSSIEGFWLAPWMARQKLLSKLRLVKAITRMMRQGVLVSDVEGTFRLDEINDAIRAVETTGRRGKVLLRIAQP